MCRVLGLSAMLLLLSTLGCDAQKGPVSSASPSGETAVKAEHISQPASPDHTAEQHAAPVKPAIEADPAARADAEKAYAQQLVELIHPTLWQAKPGIAPPFAKGRRNAYKQTVLVANKPEYNPTIMVDPLLVDGWGIAIRPPGAGGHFWISNTGTGTTTTYVGDLPGMPLFQDELKVVTIPQSRVHYPFPERPSEPTGQVYTGHSETDFIVSGEGITGPSKFLFVTLDGTVSGWTTGQTKSVVMFDNSENASHFTGCAVTESPSGNRLYVCDIGLEQVIVLDHEFKRVQVAGDFKHPGPANESYSPYNMWFYKGLLYTTFARVGDDPGEEDVYPGYGYIGVYDTEGRLIRTFEHRIQLNAPWGMAVAPDNFGAMSGTFLVSNFGDGTVVAYELESGKFIDYLRDEKGEPVMADGIWGILFGNGVKLGQTNHLYYAAGPNEERDGVFGKFEPLDP